MKSRLPEITYHILHVYNYVCCVCVFHSTPLSRESVSFSRFSKGFFTPEKSESVWFRGCAVPRENPFLKCLITMSRPGHQPHPLPTTRPQEMVTASLTEFLLSFVTEGKVHQTSPTHKLIPFPQKDLFLRCRQSKTIGIN